MNSLEEFTKDELVAELTNRNTFAGIVIYLRADARPGTPGPRLFDSREIIVTRSAALTRVGVEELLATAADLVRKIFGE